MVSMIPNQRKLPLPVKGYLANRGLSLTDFAQRIGVSRQHACMVLNRRAPLTREFALATATELGLGLEETEVLLGSPSTWSQGRWPSTQSA